MIIDENFRITFYLKKINFHTLLQLQAITFQFFHSDIDESIMQSLFFMNNGSIQHRDIIAFMSNFFTLFAGVAVIDIAVLLHYLIEIQVISSFHRNVYFYTVLI